MQIRILRSPYSKGTTLDVNGQRANVPAEGETGNIPDEMLPALANSHIEYEIVGAADEAGVGAGGLGDEGDAPAEASEEEEHIPKMNADDKDYVIALSVLDGNVASVLAALPSLSDDAVRALLAAEQGGKTRKTIIAAMNERLNPPTE